MSEFMKRHERKPVDYKMHACDDKQVLASIGKDTLIECLRKMLTIRHFEMRAEAGYQQGKIGGFFHGYMGQEAIQTAATEAIGVDHNWWITTYRCHALALLTGCTPNEAMAELYGKTTGCALGRGGSMHFYTDRLLGGFGIVGGHTPVAAGAAFSLRYQDQKGIAVCFLGDGSFAQGVNHESLNLCALWDLPIIYVVENNLWGMGTGVERAICNQPIAEKFAPGYNMEGYSCNGMEFAPCYDLFKKLYDEILENPRPVIVEMITERFRGHSISDPGLYRSKEELKAAMANDPIVHLKDHLIEMGMLTEDEYKKISDKQKAVIIDSVKFAEESPDPDPDELEEGVLLPWE